MVRLLPSVLNTRSSTVAGPAVAPHAQRALARRLAVLVAAGIVLAGCGSSDPVSPSDAVTAVWDSLSDEEKVAACEPYLDADIDGSAEVLARRAEAQHPSIPYDELFDAAVDLVSIPINNGWATVCDTTTLAPS